MPFCVCVCPYAFGYALVKTRRYPKNPKMCGPIPVMLLKTRPHYSQSSREHATPLGGTSPLPSYKEVPPPPPDCVRLAKFLGEFDQVRLPDPTEVNRTVGVRLPCDHALSLHLCNLCSEGGHDTFLLQIKCKKARIWTSF